MTLEEAIRAKIAPVAPAYALVLPDNATYPCVVYQLISSPELQTCEIVRVRVQLACWARSYGAAVTLGNRVRSLFYNRHEDVQGLHIRSLVIDSRDGVPDLVAGLYSRQVDIYVDYRNPTE